MVEFNLINISQYGVYWIGVCCGLAIANYFKLIDDQMVFGLALITALPFVLQLTHRMIENVKKNKNNNRRKD